MQFNVQNGKAARWQDKRYQELRTLAFEYVKQIVAKANELSLEQQQRNLDPKQRRESAKGPNSNTYASATHRQTINTSERVGQVAEQINQQFQLDKELKQLSILHVTSTQQQHQQQKQPQKKPPRPPPVPVSRPKQVVAVDEISCENEFDDHDERTRGRGEANNWTASGEARSEPKGKGKKGGLYSRLNWHLFISCFSTCLPQTLVDSMPSSMTRGTTGYGGGDGSGTAV